MEKKDGDNPTSENVTAGSDAPSSSTNTRIPAEKEDTPITTGIQEEEKVKIADGSGFILKGWSTTDKRGRPAAADEEDEEVLAAAVQLMKMHEDGVMKLQEKEKTMLKIQEKKPAEKKSGGLKCGECGKVFSTLRSLGSHVGHHSKMRNKKTETKTAADADERDGSSSTNAVEMEEEDDGGGGGGGEVSSKSNPNPPQNES